MEPNTNVEVKIPENCWVIKIKECLDELQQQEMEQEFCASVFNVPKELSALKPEAYIPESVSIGPYHHSRSELLDMERYKLAAAGRFQKRIKQGNFESVVVEEFKKNDGRIRSCYHKFIDYTEETLAWIMALDAAFLLECLQFYARHAEQSSDADVKQMGRVLHHSGTSAAHNSVLRDLMMLENQLPLFLLQKLLELQKGSKAEAEETLCRLVRLVCEELSPFSFKLPEGLEQNINERGHVLEALYYAIVPVSNILNVVDQENDESDTVDMSTVSEASSPVWETLSAINVRPIPFLKELHQRALTGRPARLVMKLLQRPFGRFFDKDAINTAEESSVHRTPPSRDELNIPSVVDLYFAGVKFSPSSGDLTTIKFNEETATLYVPSVKLDSNTEVILRNLVAFEAAAAPGAPVLRRYTDFMNGLIDCKKDVRVLRESGIISNQLKSDGEVASLWNSMGKCIRPSNIVYLDKVIKDLNIYYNRKWNVVMLHFVNDHIFRSWKFSSLVAAATLFLLTGLQDYCSVYNCKKWVS